MKVGLVDVVVLVVKEEKVLQKDDVMQYVSLRGFQHDKCGLQRRSLTCIIPKHLRVTECNNTVDTSRHTHLPDQRCSV